MGPLPVSVIVPAFGRPELLREALESVRVQTQAAAEIIVVDDGSEPPLDDVAREFGARYVRRPNGGVSAARNTGIAAAGQPWLALLDSDDRWMPAKLERQFEALAAFPECNVAICDYAIDSDRAAWKTTGLAAHPVYQTIPRPRTVGTFRALVQPQAARALACGSYVQPSTLVMSSALADRVGGFDETLRYCEDHEFLLRLFAQASPVAVEEPLMIYRIHGGNTSLRQAEMRRADLRVGEIVRSRPERYPFGAERIFAERRPSMLLELAKAELVAGDYAAGRKALAESLRLRPQPQTFGTLVYAMVAPSVPRGLRARALSAWSRRPWHRSRHWERKPTAR